MNSLILKRGIFTSAPRMSAAANHAPGGMKMWRNLSLFVAFPAIGIMMVNVYMHHMEEKKCGGPHRPPFIPYEHLRIRNKRFPWGDGNHGLFHNPHVNALPDGYEDEH